MELLLIALGASLLSVVNRSKISVLAGLYVLLTAVTIFVGNIFLPHFPQSLWYPLALSLTFLIIFIIGEALHKINFFLNLLIRTLLSIAALYFLTNFLMADNLIYNLQNLFLCGLAGIIASIAITLTVKLYDAKHSPLHTIFLFFLISALILFAQNQANSYGLAIAAFGTLLATNLFLTKIPTFIPEVLISLVIFQIYTLEIVNRTAKLVTFSLFDPAVLAGLFIGGALVFLISTLKISNQRSKILISFSIAIIVPILSGFILGPIVLGGFLIGSLLTETFLVLPVITNSPSHDKTAIITNLVALLITDLII